MSAAANEIIVRRAIEAIWNHGDLEVADELFDYGYLNHDGLTSDLVLGPEAIKVSAAMYRLAFPNLYVTVDELSALEDTVVVRWTAGRGSESPKVGTASERLITGTTRSRLAGGKIVETWTEWDRLHATGF